MSNYLKLEVTLKALQELGFRTPDIVINMKYGFVIKATIESLHFTTSYFQDGPYQTLEVEFGIPPQRLQKYNYMGKHDSLVGIEDWFKEKLNKAYDLAIHPKDLPLYTLKPYQVDLEV